MKRTDWVAAIHEAGHVVMLLIHEMRFHRVTIEPDDDCAGAVHHKLSKRTRDSLTYGDALEAVKAVEPLIRLALAGGVAVGIHCGTRGRWAGAGGDFQNVADYLLSAYGGDGPVFQAHLRYLKLQTHLLLNRPGQRWQTKVIAESLLKRRTLTYGEVGEVLREAAGMKCR